MIPLSPARIEHYIYSEWHVRNRKAEVHFAISLILWGIVGLILGAWKT